MKQSIVAWLCILAMALSNQGCKPEHVVDRANNSAIGVTHQIDLNKCFDAAVATYQTTQDYPKASQEYTECADAADKKAGRK